jgi:hypothetical protein
MYINIFKNYRFNDPQRRASKRWVIFGLVLAIFLILAPFAGRADCQGGQKSSSIVIHDKTKASFGGEQATQGLRDEFKSELERQKPCVHDV